VLRRILRAGSFSCTANLSRSTALVAAAEQLLQGGVDTERAAGHAGWVPGAQGWVTQSQASQAWDEGGQQLLGVQLGQNILVAGVLLLVKVEQPHAQACVVGIQGTQQATRWRMTA
jgi:hypothetical protein